MPEVNAATSQPRHHHAIDAVRRAREEREREERERAEREQAATVPAATVPAATVPAATVPAATVPAATVPAATVPANNIMFQEPVVPQKTPRELELEQQLEMERQQAEALRAQLTTAQLDEEVQRQREEELEALRKFRSEIEMNNLISLDGVQLETVDPAVAQEISQKILKPLATRMQEDFNKRLNITQEQLRAEQQARIDNEKQLSEAQLAKQREKINAAILSAHPDFENIRNSPEFSTYASQPIRPGAALSLGNLMANEYHNGNADFVIQAVAEFKQGRPSLASIAGAPVAIAATVPAGDDNTPQYTEADVAKWNEQRATGELSREEFSRLRAAYKAQKDAAQAAS